MADNLTKAEAAVAAAQEKLDKAQAGVGEAQAAFLEAQAALDEAILARDGDPNPHQDQIDRMAYIQSQAEQRAARADVAAQLRDIFPDGALPAARSALDSAMARKTKRGTARPRAETKD